MIKFQTKEVNEVAKEYKTVKLPKEYRDLMDSVSKVIAPYISMDDGAVRGFISRAIVKWQERHNKEIAEVLSMSIMERQKMMKEGMEILKEILGGVLRNSSDQENLNLAIDKGYKAYLDGFVPNIPKK